MYDHYKDLRVFQLGKHKVRAVIIESSDCEDVAVFPFYTDIKAIANGIDPEIAKLGDVNYLEVNGGNVKSICFRNSTKLLSVKEAINMLAFSELSADDSRLYRELLKRAEVDLIADYQFK